MANIRILIVGYGNVGRGVRAAIEKNGDMVLSGIVSRSPERVRAEIGDAVPVMAIEPAEAWQRELRPDVAILCGGSKDDLPKQGPQLVQYLPTVDSFDNHSRIPAYFAAVDAAAKAAKRPAVISTGWDPGIFSLERVLANAFLPGVRAYGFYGLGEHGGLSMGHSDALRTIPGIADARQYTHAIPAAVDWVRGGEAPDFRPGEMHYRVCYVVPEPGADQELIEQEIKQMPGYFEPYETTVYFITREELNEQHTGFPHDGCVVASGVTGDGNAARIEYRCSWGSNPEATANVLVAHARAAKRLADEGRSGAFTILDIPPAYLSPHCRETLLKEWM